MRKANVKSIDVIPEFRAALLVFQNRVLDSLAAGVKQAETLVDMRRLSGLRPCRKSYFTGLPDPDRVDEILAFYGQEIPRD